MEREEEGCWRKGGLVWRWSWWWSKQRLCVQPPGDDYVSKGQSLYESEEGGGRESERGEDREIENGQNTISRPFQGIQMF